MKAMIEGLFEELMQTARVEALAEGSEEGSIKNSCEIARQLLGVLGQGKFSAQSVACITSLPLEEVQRMADEMQRGLQTAGSNHTTGRLAKCPLTPTAAGGESRVRGNACLADV